MASLQMTSSRQRSRSRGTRINEDQIVVHNYDDNQGDEEETDPVTAIINAVNQQNLLQSD